MRPIFPIKSKLQHNGTSQVERLIEALAPGYFKLDDRSAKELIAATYRYAEMVQYHNGKGEIQGDWTCFWEADTLTFLAVLSTIDTDEITEGFAESEKEARQDEGKNDADAGYLEAIEYIQKIALEIESYYQKLPNGIPLKNEIKALIQRDRLTDADQLEGALKTLIGYHKEAFSLSNDTDEALSECEYEQFFGDHWGLPDRSAFFDIDNSDEYRQDDWNSLRQLVKTFHQALVRIRRRANYWFDKTIAEPQVRQPHISLFLTFLRLFQHARDEMNNLTKRHLEFYYEKVLHLSRRPSVPDDVYLVLQLANNVDQHLIEKGTTFLAGKKDGKPLMFEAIENWVVSSAKVADIKNTYLDFETNQIYASPDVKVIYENGEILLNQEADCFRAFGNDTDLPKGEIGFAIASPQLILREGKRLVTVSISTQFTENPNLGIFPEGFKIYLSSKDEWIAFEYSDTEVNERTDKSGYSVNLFDNEDGEARRMIQFSILLKEDLPAVEALGSELKVTSGFTSDWPILKVVYQDLKEGENKDEKSFYENLNSLKIPLISIRVKVEGIRENLVVQNDSGVFDGKQEFLPWGPAPRRGNHFFIGSTEVFQKEVSSAMLHFDWIDPPDFSIHYSNYIGQTSIGPEVLIDNLVGGSITEKIRITHQEPEILIRDAHGQNKSVPLINNRNIEYDIPINITFPERDAREQNFSEFSPVLKRGFIRVSLLKGTFLHEKYQRSLVLQSIVSSKDAKGSVITNQAIPNQPYTPATNGIRLDYTSEQVMEIGEGQVDEFFYLVPSEGHKKISAHASGMPLVYTFIKYDRQNDGTQTELFSSNKKDTKNHSSYVNANLYLALDPLSPGSNLALLFQFKEGSEGTFDKLPPKEEHIHWSYLSKNNEWKEITIDKILKDTTEGLTRTGIVQLETAFDIVNETTLFKGQYYWLRIAVVEEEGYSVCALPCLESVTAQVVEAVFKVDENDSTHFIAPKPLPAGEIKKLAISNSRVKKIEQPLPSFNGHLPEEGNEFYQRISERLRHRDRAVSVGDYERLLLERFPKILRAKCLQHICLKEKNNNLELQIAPGYVLNAVVPQLEKLEGAALEQPRLPLGDLREMAEYLRTKTNLFVALNNDGEAPYLDVVNPKYEPVKIEVAILFNEGFDKNYFSDILIEELKNYIAPWLADKSAGISFDRNINRSRLIQFIEEREYIQAIKQLTIRHCDTITSKRIIVPFTSRSILTTEQEHKVTEYTGNENMKGNAKKNKLLKAKK